MTSELSRKNSLIIRPKNMLEKIMRNKEEYDAKLEEIIDPEHDYEKFQTHGLYLLSPEVLYNKGLFEKSTQFFKHSREVTIQCIKNQTRILDVISQEAERQLKRLDYNFIHLGLIVIGVKGVMRKNLGCKVLITLFDSRISNITKGMIASTEVDLNSNKGIIYCSPDFLLTIKDFTKYIKIGIQTRGYEDVEEGDNLLISLGILGRCSLTSKTKYKVYTDKVVDLVSSKGIKMVKPKEFSTEELIGLDWNLSVFEEQKEKMVAPKDALMYTDRYGKTSLRFTDYVSVPNQEFEDEVECSSKNTLDSDAVHIELMDSKIDKIIFPKELNKFKQRRIITTRRPVIFI